MGGLWIRSHRGWACCNEEAQTLPVPYGPLQLPSPLSPTSGMNYNFVHRTLAQKREVSEMACLLNVSQWKGTREKGEFLIQKSSKLKQYIPVDVLFHSLREAQAN